MEPVVSMQYLAASQTVYTQAMLIPSGQNRLSLQTLYVNSSGSVSSGVKVTPEYSNDLLTWTPDAANVNTGTNAPPYLALTAFSGPSSPAPAMGSFKYVRLKIENADSIRALVSIWAAFYSVDT